MKQFIIYHIKHCLTVSVLLGALCSGISVSGQEVVYKAIHDTITMDGAEKVGLYRPEVSWYLTRCDEDGRNSHDLLDIEDCSMIVIAYSRNTQYRFLNKYKLLYKSITTDNGVKKDYFSRTWNIASKLYARHDSYSSVGIDVLYVNVPEEKLEEYDFYLDSVVLILDGNSYPPSKEKVCEK